MFNQLYIHFIFKLSMEFIFFNYIFKSKRKRKVMHQKQRLGMPEPTAFSVASTTPFARLIDFSCETAIILATTTTFFSLYQCMPTEACTGRGGRSCHGQRYVKLPFLCGLTLFFSVAIPPTPLAHSSGRFANRRYKLYISPFNRRTRSSTRAGDA
jgi:hypothetical protein